MFLSLSADQATGDLNISKFPFDLDRWPSWKPARSDVVSSLNIIINFFYCYFICYYLKIVGEIPCLPAESHCNEKTAQIKNNLLGFCTAQQNLQFYAEDFCLNDIKGLNFAKNDFSLNYFADILNSVASTYSIITVWYHVTWIKWEL